MTSNAAPVEAVENVAPIEDRQLDARLQFSAEGQQLLAQAALPARRDRPADDDIRVIDLDNPFRKPPRETTDRPPSAPGFSLVEADTPVPPRRWTMAVHLTETQSHQNDRGERVQAGAEPKLRAIQELAERTRNSPVTFYVQAPVPRERREIAENTFVQDGEQRVATYRIENGEVTLVEEGPSRGFQRDLQSLLERASARAGAGNLGLTIQSHGFGTDGVGGETGEASLAELERSITDGLRASGRQTLDVLNFDSCSMGNIDVAQAMQGEARHVIASSELERTFGDTVDGQNLRATFNALLDNPDMTPEELARTAIDLARTGANGDETTIPEQRAGTETLSHYDLHNFPQVEQAVDSLGRALTEAGADPAQREVLMQIMRDLPHYHAGTNHGIRFSAENADLGLFIEALDKAVSEGRLNDASGGIRQAIEGTRTAMRDLVPGYFGQPYNNYDRMSGVSIFLPGSNAFNISERALQSSAIGELADTLDSPKAMGFDNRPLTLSRIEQNIEEMRASVDVSPLDRALQALRDATSEDAYARAAANLQAETTKFLQSPFGQSVINAQRAEVVRRRDEMFDRQLMRSPAAWRDFINSLRQGPN